MEKVFFNLAKDLQMEEMIEQDFPHLMSSDSLKEKIKKDFNLVDFTSISTDNLARKLAANPLMIRDIYTYR